MRDGNAKADASAHRFLACSQGREHGFLVLRPDFVHGNEEFYEFHDRTPPLGGFHFGKDLLNRQKVAKIHCLLLIEWRGIFRGGDCNKGVRVDKRDLGGAARGRFARVSVRVMSDRANASFFWQIRAGRAHGERMRILMASTEMAPLARTGGLGDVVEALPAELQRRGEEVSVILPYYRSIRENKSLRVEPTGVMMTIEVGARRIETEILESQAPNGVQIFFVRRDEYFDRSEIYGADGRAYEDNAERFIFFSKAAVELARRLVPAPDVVQAHDWQTALIPVFIKQRQLPFKTVLTIHNIAYQGSFWGVDFGLTNLPGSYFGATGVEFYGRLNFMKGGIMYADAVTTVSEHYGRDIQTPEYGAGLDAVAREHAGKIRGILNGADYGQWNPATDKLIPATYSADAPAGKVVCRDSLLQELGLAPSPRGPVLCMVTRLAEQKGFDILIPLLDRLLADDIRLVIQAEGDSEYNRELTMAAKRHPERFAFRAATDDALAHRIYAGADVMLMPSHFEPCGLAAMYSLKYGTVPIARATGGLYQILQDYDPTTGAGNAVLFYDYTEEALWDSIRRAKRQFADTEAWQRLVHQAMECNFSWKEAAEHYEKLYKELVGEKVEVEESAAV
jgi:starch synthase